MSVMVVILILRQLAYSPYCVISQPYIPYIRCALSVILILSQLAYCLYYLMSQPAYFPY